MFENFGPVIFFCTVIIGMLILYESKKASGKKDAASRDYWDREARANSVRRKDITFLDYISVEPDNLPFIETDDIEILEYQDTIRRLSSKKILNLTNVSNTEIKEAYGVANLDTLSDYDNNYTTLVNTIVKWGRRLIDLGYTKEATAVLEYGIQIKSDASRNYYMLADLYKKSGDTDKIDGLIEVASSLNSIMKDKIIAKLTDMKG